MEQIPIKRELPHALLIDQIDPHRTGEIVAGMKHLRLEWQPCSCPQGFFGAIVDAAVVALVIQFRQLTWHVAGRLHIRLRHLAAGNFNGMLEAEELSRLGGTRSEQEAYDHANRSPAGGMERPNEAIAFLDIHVSASISRRDFGNGYF